MTDLSSLICDESACAVVPATPAEVPVAAPVLHIEMVSDWVCPYCPIAEATLQRALQDFPDLTVELVHAPYMLNPDLPPEGMDRALFLQQKQADLQQVAQNETTLTARAAEVGWSYRYDRIQRTPHTLNAHRLAHFALQQGKQQEVATLLFQAHFSQGKDLSQLQVLLDIALQCGLNPQEVEAYLVSDQDRQELRDLALGQKPLRGIKGVPSFFFNGTLVVTGAVPIEQFRAALQAIQAP